MILEDGMNIQVQTTEGLKTDLYFTQAQIDTLPRLAKCDNETVDEFLTSVIQIITEGDIKDGTLVWNDTGLLDLWNGKSEDDEDSQGVVRYRAMLSFTDGQLDVIRRLAAVNLLSLEEWLSVKAAAMIQGLVDALISDDKLSVEEGKRIENAWRT